MIVAHAPGGFLLTTWLLRTTPVASRRRALWWGIAGSVAPDLDWLWLLQAAHPRNHHTYWTHWPVTWLLLILTMQLLRRRWSWATYGWLFALNGMLHMLLDTVAGRIWWFSPWVDHAYSLFTVRPMLTPWWVNFLVHPTFGLELLICAAAGWVWYRNRRTAQVLTLES